MIIAKISQYLQHGVSLWTLANSFSDFTYSMFNAEIIGKEKQR